MLKQRSLFVMLSFLLVVPWGARAECTPGVDGCMPEAEECGSGDYNGVWLGRHKASLAACAGANDTTIAYAGGYAIGLCGSIWVLDEAAFDTGANACDRSVARGSNELRFRVQLPSDYGSSDERYPVLYLLPGGGGTEDSWFDLMDLSQIADQGVIIVSPFNGLSFYNDWRSGEIQMETLFVEQLIPTIDATYRTLPDRAHRAIAGFSQGGYGALFLPARHPDLFSVSAAFSATVALRDPSVTQMWVAYGFGPLTGPYDHIDPVNPIWGDWIADEVWWRDRNPIDLLPNLEHLDMTLEVGNGLPGKYNPAPAVPPLDPETDLWLENEHFVADARAHGLDPVYRVHDGSHVFTYGADALLAWVPDMFASFGAPDPTSFSYRSVEPSFDAWGWGFATDPRRAPEFLDVVDASSDGVTLTGSGLTNVTTAPMFAPGQTVMLSGASASAATADAEGRITFEVDLGPPHAAQQYTPAAAAQRMTTVEVSFA